MTIVTVVTVVTIKMRVGAVSKIPSQSSQPSHGVQENADANKSGLIEFDRHLSDKGC